MYKLKTVLLSLLVLMLLASFLVGTKSSSYKCLIQMVNYNGEGAYLVISLIDPDGHYQKTLFVQGDDDEWYPDMTEWWDYFDSEEENIDAITGATIGGGERAISVFDIEDSKVDAGYKIRFETAVEDQEYYLDDVEFPLTSENIKSKFEGKGYIRYVRMMPN
ncbi:MAG: DUF2271 domain-containing protein [Cyclobacteriaceae bacterium]